MQQEGSRETKSLVNMYNRPPWFACRRSLVFVRPRAFQPLNKKREKERQREREKGIGSLALPTRANHCCHPFIAWSNSRQSSLSFQSTTPAIPPMHPRSLSLPSHQSKQYSDPLCLAESSLSLKVDSRWISFSGVKRTRVAFLLDFPFRSRSVTPCHRHLRPSTAALSHFLVSRWNTPCWMSRCEYERGDWIF